MDKQTIQNVETMLENGEDLSLDLEVAYEFTKFLSWFDAKENNDDNIKEKES